MYVKIQQKMSRTRSNFSAKFKASLVLQVLKGEKDIKKEPMQHIFDEMQILKDDLDLLNEKLKSCFVEPVLDDKIEKIYAPGKEIT